MANLINEEMLHPARRENYLTWVGTRDLPYKYGGLYARRGQPHDCHLRATGQYVFSRY
jgi:hypothetical protein